MKNIFIILYSACFAIASLGCAPTRMFFCPFPDRIVNAKKTILNYEFYTFPWDSHVWVETEMEKPPNCVQFEYPDLKASEPEVYLDGIPLDTKLKSWETFREYISPIKSGKHTLSIVVDEALIDFVKKNDISLFFQINGSISGPWFFYWRNMDVRPDYETFPSDDETCPTCGRVVLKDNTIRKNDFNYPGVRWSRKESPSDETSSDESIPSK